MTGEHKKPEYAKINPYQQVPGMTDGEVAIGESVAILRYIALNYLPSAYPLDKPALCAKIDNAAEAFSQCYGFHSKTVYVVYGYAGPQADQAAQCAGYVTAAEKWIDSFVGEGATFVGGDTPSIADYKAAPFLFSAVQPACKKLIGLEMPPKVVAYVNAFCKAVASSAFMNSAGGYSLKEIAASKC